MKDFVNLFRYGFDGPEINPIVLIIVIVAGIAVSIGLFFLFRAITLWYFKINKMYKELQKTNRYLEQMLMNGANPAASERAPMPVPNPVAAEPVQQTAPLPVTPIPAAPVPVVPVQTAPVVAEAPAAPVAAEPVQRTCANCGAVLQEGAAFCMACGTRN